MPINFQWDVQNDFKLSFHSSVAEWFQGIWMSFFVLFLLSRKPNPKFVSVWWSLLNKKHFDECTQLFMGIDCIVFWLLYVRRNENVLINFHWSVNLRLHEKYWGGGGGSSITANLFQNNYLTLKILYSFRT